MKTNSTNKNILITVGVFFFLASLVYLDTSTFMLSQRSTVSSKAPVSAAPKKVTSDVLEFPKTIKVLNGNVLKTAPGANQLSDPLLGKGVSLSLFFPIGTNSSDKSTECKALFNGSVNFLDKSFTDMSKWTVRCQVRTEERNNRFGVYVDYQAYQISTQNAD